MQKFAAGSEAGTLRRSLAGGRSRDRKVIRMSARASQVQQLLTPSEVAIMFRVDPKTVTRWAKTGKLSSIRTLGGHRRYREAEVSRLLSGIPEQGNSSVSTTTEF
jgi:excisionase family DNA binding protein